MSPHFVKNEENPASTSTRLDTGDDHDACMILARSSQIVPDSGDVVATPGPMPGPEAVQSSPRSRQLSPPLTNEEPVQFFV
ncbi:hypothetical protein D3C83_52950 [compost metagenome]